MTKWIMICLILVTTSANAETKITKDTMGYTHYSGDVSGKSSNDSMGYRHYDFHSNGNTQHCRSSRVGNSVNFRCY